MSRPWMPLYVGDYRADTTHLNATQHGAYLLLIMHYWQQGSLPDDDAQLARIACLSAAEWRRHRPVVRAFFSEGWRHGRIDREMEGAEAAYERRSKAGRAGGKARSKPKQCLSNAQAMLKQSQPQSQVLRTSPSHEEGREVEGYALAAGPFAVVRGGR